MNLGARSWWVVSTTPWPLYPRERPGTHSTGGWVGPRAGLDVCEKSRPHRDFWGGGGSFTNLYCPTPSLTYTSTKWHEHLHHQQQPLSQPRPLFHTLTGTMHPEPHCYHPTFHKDHTSHTHGSNEHSPIPTPFSPSTNPHHHFTSPLPGFDPRTVQPVVSRYTDWATGPTLPKNAWRYTRGVA
jgi:hypothetical protein